MSHETVNIVVVGDDFVGKTCLLHAYTDESFETFHYPTIPGIEPIELHLDGYKIHLHDTPGQEVYEPIRKLFYQDADCFLLCYSIDDRFSYVNIITKWFPEITAEKLVPIVLVATKMDLRQDINTEVSTAEGEKLERKINAISFVECSAKEGQNVKLAVEEAIRACFRGVPELEQEDRRGGMCSIS